MTDETFAQIPSELAQRLEAAGVTDAVSLQTALERDPLPHLQRRPLPARPLTTATRR